MGKPMSWKWKLLIAFVVGSLFMMAFIMTPWGHQWMHNYIVKAYNETPEAERRDSPLADSYITLAWWRGTICQDSKAAMEMYREFCGLPKDRNDNSVFTKYKLNSPLCSPDGDTGWGAAHPRAPEAYYAYLEICEVEFSSQFTNGECQNYYKLFYYWMERSKAKKPHPLFNKYWPRVLNIIDKRPLPLDPMIDRKAPRAPKYVDPDAAPKADEKGAPAKA